MANAAQYAASLTLSLDEMEKQIAVARQKLSAIGHNLPATGIDSFLGKVGIKLKQFGQDAERVGRGLSIGLTVPLTLLGREVVQAGSSFESAFAGVRKTVNATEPEFAALRQQFRDMAKEIPITANELARIGEAAGQLGIKKENIIEFSRVMADLGVTTNLTSDQAATALARLANITQMNQDQFSNLGSTIVALGNNFATTEAEITEMGLRLAGAGEQVGLTEAQILSFAAALTSVGINAEAGGTAFSRVFLNMSSAVKGGGADLANFAKVAGQTTAQFKQQFETDAAGAVLAFVQGLKRLSDQGVDVTKVLGGLELNEIRVRDALLRTANAGDLLRDAINLGTKAWEENTALTKEAQERYKTFDSQVQLLKNQLTDVAITLFDKLRPALTSALDRVRDAVDAFGKLDAGVLEAAVTFATVAGTAGPLALLIGKLAQLGPKGLIITGAITAVGLLAAAYKTNYSQMGDSVDSFVARLTGANERAGDSNSKFMRGVQEGLQGIGFALDLILTSIGTVITGILSGVKQIFFILTGNFSAFLQENKRFAAENSKVWDQFHERGVKRARETYEIMRGDQKSHSKWVIEQWGATGGDSSRAFKRDFTAQDPVKGIASDIVSDIERAHPGIVKKFGILASDSAKTFKGFWRSETTQSPFFIIGDVLDAIGVIAIQGPPRIAAAGKAIGKSLKEGVGKDRILERVEKEFIEFPAKLQAEVAPKLKNAAKQMAKDMRAAFDDLLADLNNWSKANEVGIDFTAELWASLPKEMRKSTFEQQKIFKEMEKGWGEAIAKVALQMQKVVQVTREGFSKAAQDSIKGMQGLNEEVAKNSESWRGWSGDVADAGEAARRMIEITSQLPVHLRQTAVDLLEVNEQLAIMVKRAQSAGDAVKYGAEHIAGFDKAMEQAAPQTERLNKQVEELQRQMEEVSRRIPSSVNAILDAFGKLSLRTKSIFADIFDIIGLLPGKVGNALQRAVNEFERWFTLIDKVVRVVERVFGENETEGIIGIIRAGVDKVIGIFRDDLPQATVTVEDVLKGIGTEAQDAATQVEAGSKRMVTALATIGAAAAALGAIIGGRAGAAIGGAGAGLGLGAAIGSLFGPGGTAIGAIIGGIGGGLLGFIFGGKSELQKAQEAAQLQQAKDAIRLSQEQVNQAIEATKQSLIQTADQARQLLESLLDFTKVPKATIKAFFQNLTQVMNEFAKMAERWKTESLEKTKALAEAMGPVVQSIGGAVIALAAMNSFIPVAESIIDDFFRTLGLVVTKFGELADEIPNKLEKHAKKFANRMGPIIGVIAQAIEAFAFSETGGLANIKEIPEVAFENLKAAINLAVVKMEEIASSIDNSMVKAAQRFAEKASSVVGLIGEAVGNFANLKEFVAPTPEIFNSLFASIKLALERMNEMAATLSTEFLGRAEMIAGKSLAVVNFIGTAAQAFSALKDYSKIPEENMQALLDDFKRALDLLHLLLSDADRFEQMAKTFQATIQRGADALKAGIESFATSFLSAASTLNAAIGHVQGGVATAAFPSTDFSIPQSEIRAIPSQSSTSVTYDNRRFITLGDVTVGSDDARFRKLEQALEEIFGVGQIAGQYL